MKYDVFISYSRADSAVADRICEAFDKAGINYFIDRQGIGGGFEFPVVLAEAIVESKVVLFLASKSSYESKFTNAELTFAFNEKPKNSILPYIIDGSTMPSALRFVFSSINWRTIKSHPIEPILVNDILKMLGRDAECALRTKAEEEQHQARIEKIKKHAGAIMVSILLIVGVIAGFVVIKDWAAERQQRIEEQIAADSIGVATERAAERAEAERIAAEKAEQERIAKQKAEAERIAKEEAEAQRLADEKAAADQAAKAKAEADRKAKERAEAERKAAEKAAKEKAEAERVAAEKAEQEAAAKAKAEAEQNVEAKIQKALKEDKTEVDVEEFSKAFDKAAQAAEKTYKVGDYYNDGTKEGVVFWVDATGKHGKIVSLTQTKLNWCTKAQYDKEIVVGATSKTDGKANTDKVMARADSREYPAFVWCRNMGKSWYLPAIDELELLLLNDAVHDAVNKTLESRGATILYVRGSTAWYWSSTEDAGNPEFCAWIVNMYNGNTRNFIKYGNPQVRAVSAF